MVGLWVQGGGSMTKVWTGESEGITEEEFSRNEYNLTGTSVTGHKEFDDNGYLVARNLFDPKEFDSNLPADIGIGRYDWNSQFSGDEVDINIYEFEEGQGQVDGCIARRNFPPHNHLHLKIGRKIEKIIGRKLYPTYQYDRFYYPGQLLYAHSDQPNCEISISLHISSNVKNPWPFWIKTPDTYDSTNPKHGFRTRILKKGEARSINLYAGDAIIYKGCERPHWRNELPKEYIRVWNMQYSDVDGDMSDDMPPVDKMHNTSHKGKVIEKEGLYYHQAFFHYVLADGIRSIYAFDDHKGEDVIFFNVDWNHQ